MNAGVSTAPWIGVFPPPPFNVLKSGISSNPPWSIWLTSKHEALFPCRLRRLKPCVCVCVFKVPVLHSHFSSKESEPRNDLFYIKKGGVGGHETSWGFKQVGPAGRQHKASFCTPVLGCRLHLCPPPVCICAASAREELAGANWEAWSPSLSLKPSLFTPHVSAGSLRWRRF